VGDVVGDWISDRHLRTDPSPRHRAIQHRDVRTVALVLFSPSPLTWARCCSTRWSYATESSTEWHCGRRSVRGANTIQQRRANDSRGVPSEDRPWGPCQPALSAREWHRQLAHSRHCHHRDDSPLARRSGLNFGAERSPDRRQTAPPAPSLKPSYKAQRTLVATYGQRSRDARVTTSGGGRVGIRATCRR
jgi:hypothetical protein